MNRFLAAALCGAGLMVAFAEAAAAEFDEAPNYADAVFCAAFTEQIAVQFSTRAQANPNDPDLKINFEASMEASEYALDWAYDYDDRTDISSAETERARAYVLARGENVTRAGTQASIFDELERCWIMFVPPEG